MNYPHLSITPTLKQMNLPKNATAFETSNRRYSASTPFYLTSRILEKLNTALEEFYKIQKENLFDNRHSTNYLNQKLGLFNQKVAELFGLMTKDVPNSRIGICNLNFPQEEIYLHTDPVKFSIITTTIGPTTRICRSNSDINQGVYAVPQGFMLCLNNQKQKAPHFSPVTTTTNDSGIDVNIDRHALVILLGDS